MSKNVILKAPTHIELTITEMCNHKCKHCYNAWREETPQNDFFDKRKIDHILDELIKCQVTYVTITGGEPLLCLDRMFYIISRLKELDIGIGLNTNLSLMTNSIAKKLKEKYHWGNTILTSLPGFTEEECDKITQVKGSLKKIENGIETCLFNNIPVGVNVVITKSNLNNLNDLLDFLERHKVSVLALTRVVPPVYDSDNSNFRLSKDDVNKMVDFLRLVKEKYKIKVTSLCSLPLCLLDEEEDMELFSTKCAAGIIACSINGITGEVTPCAHNDISYGNIYEKSLFDIWEKMRLWRTGEYLPTECKNCKMITACGGDCRLNALRFKNKPYQLKKIELHKYKSQENVFLLKNSITYSFNQKTVIRNEEFGAVVSLGNNEFYVTHSVKSLILILKNKKEFTLKDILLICELNDYMKRLLNQLLVAEIVYEV